MVKHAAHEQQPLLTAAERAHRAIREVTTGKRFMDEQPAWSGWLRSHLIQNVSIDHEDFVGLPVFPRDEGRRRANNVCHNRLGGLP